MKMVLGLWHCSWVDAVEGSGERNGFADVVEAAYPGYGALDAHAEARVRDAAVAAQVQVPLECLLGEVMLLDAGVEQFITRNALRAADDFAVTLGGQHVDAESEPGVGGVGFHVEGLYAGGIAVDHNRAVKLIAQPSFVGRAEVVPIFKRRFELAVFVGLVEHRGGLVVAQTREGRSDGFQLGAIAANYY
jgi:hypothetical protein